MIDVDDIRWRDAAANLDLELVDADGNAVDRASATREARMRGIVDGAQVRVRYGFRDPRDHIIVTHVRLKQPLLLGLRLHSYAPPKRSSGGSVGGPLRFSIEGIERAQPSRCSTSLRADARSPSFFVGSARSAGPS